MIDLSSLSTSGGESDVLYRFANSELLQAKAYEFLCLFFLGLMRIIPIVATAPFLGSRVLPIPVKVIEAVCLFLVFFPVILRTTLTEVTFNGPFLLLMAKEFIIGLILGFFVSLPFSLMQSVGVLIDHQRGSASLMVNDPTTQNQSSPLGLFFNMILIYLFFVVDGPFIFFEAMNYSYELIPPDKFLSPVFFNLKSPFWERAIPLANQFMVLTVQLAAPSLIIILMTDFFLGIANRLAPQVQIIFLGLGLKAGMPLIVIALGWSLFLEVSTIESVRETRSLNDIIREMAGQLQTTDKEHPTSVQPAPL